MKNMNPHGAFCPWHDWAEKMGAPNIKWCEETLCQWISEPSNTWSNLGFLIIGLLIFVISIKRKDDGRLKQFGPIIFFMEVLSFFYHLSNFYGSQILDFVGMFIFTGWVIGMNLIRMGKLLAHRLPWFYIMFVVIMTAVLHAMYLLQIKFQVLILVSAIVIVFTEKMIRQKHRIHYRFFTLGLTLIVIALSFSFLDHRRAWCDSSNHGWFSQGHAIWHWVASLGMLAIYFHYSQKDLRESESR